MQVIVSKWGNSLAIRIPSEAARALAIHEGSVVECITTADGRLELVPRDEASRARAVQAHFARVAERTANAPQTTPARELLRQEERY